MNIAWRDVPRYLDAFHPSKEGRVQNTGEALAVMTVICDQGEKKKALVTIDLLPLIKLHLAQDSFVVNFVRSDDEAGRVAASITEEDKSYFKGDSDILHIMVRHRIERWLHDINSGHILGITCSPIGTAAEPDLRIRKHYEPRRSTRSAEEEDL